MLEDKINVIVGKYLTLEILKHSIFREEVLKYSIDNDKFFLQYIKPYKKYLDDLSNCVIIPVYERSKYIDKNAYVNYMNEYLTSFFIRTENDDKTLFLKKVQRNYILDNI